MTTALILALQLTVSLPASGELWPESRDGLQHRALGTALAELDMGRFRVTARYGLEWWGDEDAQIPGSPFNLESNRALVRIQGVGANVRIGTCRIGGRYYRRGFEDLPQARRWGPADDPGTIGYWDVVWPHGECSMRGAEVSVNGPRIDVNQPLTWPYPDYRAETSVTTGWRGHVHGYVEWGGISEPAWDVLACYRVGPVCLGGAWGEVQAPTGHAVRRGAIAVHLHSEGRN